MADRGHVSHTRRGGSEGTHIHATGSRHLPAVLVTEASFGAQFQFSRMPCQTALLTVRAFSWPDVPQFLQFTRQAFTRMRELNVRHLVIDVRDNSGGDDDFWKQGILPYFATKPYRWGSTYEKRVLDEFRDAGETTARSSAGRSKTGSRRSLGIPRIFRATSTC